MAAGHAVDAVRFDDEFVGPNLHASAIRSAGKMNPLVVHHFILGPTKAIDRLSIEYGYSLSKISRAVGLYYSTISHLVNSQVSDDAQDKI